MSKAPSSDSKSTLYCSFCGKRQFRSDLRVGKVTAPVLVVHGEDDAVVPVTLGERLFGLIRAPKRFVRIASAGHNNLGARAVEAAKQFIAVQ
jgi:fermentation-respiration switch protein FrsA (DUF1100 family)